MRERSSVGFEIGAESKPSRVETAERRPFRIALFGDFTGRANRGLKGGARAAKAWRLDADTFDQVFAKCAPALDLPLPGDAGRTMHLSFSSLDDFHPDELYARLPIFASFRDLRTRLSNPATFREAAAELTGVTPAPPAPPKPPAPAPVKPDLAAMAGGSLLDRMVDDADIEPEQRRSARPDELQAFINRAVAGHVVPGKTKQQDDLVASVDAAVSEQLRSLLHHPDFQALEAAWRGLFFLIQRLEIGVDLQLFVFDVSKAELVEDLNQAKDLRDTAFLHHVITQTTGDEPWALLAANYSFDATPDDVDLLSRIAMIARKAEAPFLAAAQAAVVGCQSMTGTPDPRKWSVDSVAAEFWRALRALPEAGYIGLAAPRFLLRLPYGGETSPVDAFPFEEMPATPVHEHYLWGNPAIACVCLLAQTFDAEGWDMRPGAIREISGLPLHVYQDDGESQAQPCAEALLTDTAVEAIVARGVMPLIPSKNDDSVLLGRFQSVADPPRALAGRW